jgi:hypothetical protein
MCRRLGTGPSTALLRDFTLTYAAVDNHPTDTAHTEGAFPREGAFLALPVRGSAAAALT